MLLPKYSDTELLAVAKLHHQVWHPIWRGASVQQARDIWIAKNLEQNQCPERVPVLGLVPAGYRT
jgi:hypothetical protein